MKLLLLILLCSVLTNPYEKAEQLANNLLSIKHDGSYTSDYCHFKSITLHDSILNVQSNYEFISPIFKIKNQITYYENGKIAKIEKSISSIEIIIDPNTTLESLLVT